jgi:hypothetical protein
VKPLALALCVALAATGARASDPVFASPDPAPDVYGPLVWRAGGVDTHGYFYRDEQVQRLKLELDKRQAQIDFLTDRATKACVEATNAETRKVLGASRTTWIVGASALLVGILGGLYLGHRI